MTDGFDNPRLASLFGLEGKVAIVTGGAGLLGQHHRRILEMAGASVVSVDICEDDHHGSIVADITDPIAVKRLTDEIIEQYGAIDILINNAANNPKAEDTTTASWSRLETFDLQLWNQDLAVGLTGALLMCQAAGSHMAARRQGVILNVCSDLAVIAPDQRLYRKKDLEDLDQPVKPVSYSVVKHGLLGLTKYLATYWADCNVRVNAISPGGIANGQDSEFVARLSSRIPLARMANADEYEGAVLFLCSNSSSYMNGHNLVIDGGRTVW